MSSVDPLFFSHLQDVCENATVALFVMDTQQCCVYMNPAAEVLTGYCLEEVQGGPLHDFIHHTKPDGTHYHLEDCPIDRAAPTNMQERGQEIFVHRDGSFYPVEFTASPVWRDGKLAGTVIEVLDARPQQQREREREILQNISALILDELDREKIVQAVTDAATALTGAQFGAFFYNVRGEQGESYTLYTISGVPKERFSQFPLPRTTHLFGPTFRGEGVIRSADVRADPRYGQMGPHFGMPAGHLPVRSYLAVPVRLGSGEIIGGLFFGHEDTDRFTQSHERVVEMLAAQAAVGLNKAALYQEALFARKRAEQDAVEKHLAERRQAFQLSLADSLRKLTDPDAIAAQAAAMLGEYLGAARAAYGEVDAESSTVLVRGEWADGTAAVASGTSAPLSFLVTLQDLARLKAGHTVRQDPALAPSAAGVLAVPLLRKETLAALLYVHRAPSHRWSDADATLAEDVAHRTWDAIERAQAELALLRADRRKDEFLAMLAHELRNPLAPISSAAQLLESGKLPPQRVVGTGQIVARQVNHMTTLLDDLLDVSRVTRGMVELELELVDLRTVADTAIEQLRPLIDARRHRLQFSPPSEPMMMRGDFVRLVQVVANVLSNSTKYSPEGSTILLSLREEAGKLRLTVRDNGNGIEPELLPHMFDLFVQGSRTLGRTQGGLGLGLALVRSLVELHGGQVQAVSPGVGQGTTIVFDFPRPLEHATAPGAVEGRAAASEGAKAGLRVLLVDDNVDAATLMAQLIEHGGHTVSVAHSAGAALPLAAKLRPQVVVLDIGLPDMDGYELVGKLRELPGANDAHYIALTGYGRAEDRERALSAGFWRHLTKPASTATLFAYLDEVAALLA